LVVVWALFVLGLVVVVPIFGSYYETCFLFMLS
jgi:hypothetical protein